MPDQQWGAPTPAGNGWGTPVPVKEEPKKAPSLLDMFKPSDPSGNTFTPHLPIPKVPRAAAPILGMVAALLTRGLSLPAQVAGGTLAGAVGGGVDDLTHGETPSIGSMAGEGALQGAFSAAPMVPRGAAKIGEMMHIANVRPLRGAALGALAGHAVGGPVGAVSGSIIGEAAAPDIQRVINSAGYKIHNVADSVANATTPGTPMIEHGVGVTVKGSRVPALPDALRKMQILIQSLYPHKDPQ